MVRLVHAAALGGQQLHRLADAAGLVNRALLADGQVHGQVQEGVVLAVLACELLRQGVGFIGQHRVVFGVLGHPFTGQHFQGVNQRMRLMLGIDLTEEATNIVLRRAVHSRRLSTKRIS